MSKSIKKLKICKKNTENLPKNRKICPKIGKIFFADASLAAYTVLYFLRKERTVYVRWGRGFYPSPTEALRASDCKRFASLRAVRCRVHERE